jgi:fucose permease
MTGKWTSGYINIGLLQIFIGIILLLTIGFWDQKVEVAQVEEKIEKGKFEPRMIYGLSFYFLYVGAEFGVGLWTNSYLVESLHIDPKISGLFVAGYYAAIMSGRFLSGIISNKLGNQNMLRLGLSIAILGLGLLSLKPSAEVTRIALILTGLGFAPLYPSMMHETPKRFNIPNGALMIGLQVGVSYVGGTLITNALGQWFAWTSIDWLYPIIFVLALGMMIVSEFYKSSSKQFKSTESTVI